MHSKGSSLSNDQRVCEAGRACRPRCARLHWVAGVMRSMWQAGWPSKSREPGHRCSAAARPGGSLVGRPRGARALCCRHCYACCGAAAQPLLLPVLSPCKVAHAVAVALWLLVITAGPCPATPHCGDLRYQVRQKGSWGAGSVPLWHCYLCRHQLQTVAWSSLLSF